MEIVYHGHSCFRLTERGLATVVTDPYNQEEVGYSPLKLRADIVTVSTQTPGHDNPEVVKNKSHTLTGPGEFEIGGVFITGVQTDGKTRRNPAIKRNTLFVFDYSGVTVAHLGDIRRVPSQTEIEALGTVRIALVPVGGGDGLNAAKAAEVVSLLEPGLVIPMHYATPDGKLDLDPLGKFLKEMGLGTVEPIDSLKVLRSSVPDETRVVVLDYIHG